MTTGFEEVDYMPDDIKQADPATQYAYALKVYSESIIVEIEANKAASAATNKRKFLQREEERLKKAYLMPEEITIGLTIEPVTTTIPINQQETPLFTENGEVKVSETKSSINQKKPATRPKDEPWTVSTMKAIEAIDGPSTSEDVCSYYGVTGTDIRKTVRSAVKYLRDTRKIYGIAFYVAPTIEGKAYRKVFINVLSRFYENNDINGPLKDHYQQLLDTEAKLRGLITFEELQTRGGSVINED
jgi:hypothetical protein